MACEHFNFEAKADITRLTNEHGTVTGYNADLRIRCADCGMEFQFMGMDAGYDPSEPRVSIDATEARLPICPNGEIMSALGRIAMAVPRT